MDNKTEQNESLNSLGFITSQLRRSLVIGFIAIILGAWYFDHESLSGDKINCAEINKELTEKLYKEVAEHMSDLKLETEYRKRIEEKQMELEFQKRGVERQIKKLNTEE